MSNQRSTPSAVIADDQQPTQRSGTRGSAAWQSLLAGAVRDRDELLRLVGLADSEPAACQAAFGTLVPRPFIDRMRPGDRCDPLLLQVIPTVAENEQHAGFVADPVGESPTASATAAKAPCLLQKYRGRSLILTTDECGVHCRYCFRRHHPQGCGDSGPALMQQLSAAVAHIAADTSIREVILSGGDPLSVDDARLAELIERLEAIDHISRLRVHTRMPVVIPQRITPELVGLLRLSRLSVTVVIQANHPNELSGEVEAALAALIDRGVPVLSQSVLLAGVNDNIAALAGLCERLVDMRVMPYYLHQLDRVAGAARFEVPVDRGRRLIAALRELLPGYAVPRYVRETPGEMHKRLLA